MTQNIMHIAILVNDYDEAIAFYTKKLHFDLIEDTMVSHSKRWVLVRPKGATECALLLAKATNDKQISSIGNQSGGRVFLFLRTNDFDRDYENLIRNNIKVVRPPALENYGKVAVFADLYGNLWDLIQSPAP
ncbi:VOC family protein [Pedobacter sandarakinus]|uniref:VOC family protein n=1 Tax=Pedobacter sandarakinus TaxID=353156 RepID=UPI00224536D7|nr:VOC family protein [Pedobacter sandarakinus]MCX2574748.1 VOC family protein [Pedobacter sandarakinus]